VIEASVLIGPSVGKTSSEHLLGTVASVDPLRVRLDGDSIALPYTPSLMTPAVLSEGDRVLGVLIGGRLCLIGGSTAATQPSAFSTGMILDYGGDVAPFGFLLGGQNVSRTTYAALFAVFGTKYGAGDGSTTFGLPKAGVVRVSRDPAQSEFDTVGKFGGHKSLASHRHTITMAPGDAGVPEWANPDGTSTPRTWAAAGGPVTTYNRGFSDYVGAGNAGNLQPYQVSNVIIKY